jgi:glycosyltransferase involved in cell wall biosynthesis
LWSLAKLKATTKKSKSTLLVAEYGEYGGTRTYFISLLNYLKKQGYEVTILDNLNLRDKEIEQLVEDLSFKWLSVNFDLWGINFQERPLGVSINAMFQQLLNELLFLSRILLKGRYSNLIFTVAYPGKYLHNIIFPLKFLYILHTPVTVYADKFTRLWVKCFLSKSRKIITVSKSALSDIYKFWFDGKIVKHMHVVYNYYSPKYNNNSLAIKETCLTVLTIGSLEYYKNPFYFIEVAQQILEKLPNVQFIWAGEGSLMDECQKRVNSMPTVQFVGHINNVETLYEQATVYFQPSLMESHGIATVGAMYHAIPCVVSSYGGLKESVCHDVNGYVDEVDDAKHTANRILSLLMQPQVCHEMGARGKSIYNEKFTEEKWQKAMQEHLKINV